MDLASLYHYLNTEVADKRTNHLFMINSPVPLVVITLIYLYIVLKWGPNYMKDRKPYLLKTFIRVYNIFQVIVNFWIVYGAIDAGWYRNYFFSCKNIDFSYNPDALKYATLLRLLFYVKVIDYIETVVFVLRKKTDQVSFLHLYHHVTTAWIGWMITKYYACGPTMTVAVVNCSVHVIMYLYYFLSSYGPTIQRLLNPVKRAITTIQMVQFVGLLLYSLQVFQPSCRELVIPGIIIFIDVFVNLLLFYNFYQSKYKTKKTKAK